MLYEYEQWQILGWVQGLLLFIHFGKVLGKTCLGWAVPSWMPALLVVCRFSWNTETHYLWNFHHWYGEDRSWWGGGTTPGWGPPHSGQPCCIIYCFINLPLDGKLKRSPLVVKYNNMQAINIGTKIFYQSEANHWTVNTSVWACCTPASKRSSQQVKEPAT